jgi:hypothetical protein
VSGTRFLIGREFKQWVCSLIYRYTYCQQMAHLCRTVPLRILSRVGTELGNRISAELWLGKMVWREDNPCVAVSVCSAFTFSLFRLSEHTSMWQWRKCCWCFCPIKHTDKIGSISSQKYKTIFNCYLKRRRNCIQNWDFIRLKRRLSDQYSKYMSRSHTGHGEIDSII